MRKLRVYTCGYMHGEGSDRHRWRDSLVEQCRIDTSLRPTRSIPKMQENIDWLHPGVLPGAVPGKGDLRQYSVRDALLIQRCDVLFAYVDITVARNLGAAAEIGFAWAYGKLVVMVNANEETKLCQSLDLCRAWCHYEFDSWDAAVAHLKFLAEGFRPI